MQAVTDRPGVDEVGPLSLAPALPQSREGSTFARGAVIATALALFPWSLVVLFIAFQRSFINSIASSGVKG